MWRQTENEYRAAADALIKIQTTRDVQVQTAEGAAPDFSHEKPNVSYTRLATMSLGPAALGAEVARVHALSFANRRPS